MTVVAWRVFGRLRISELGYPMLPGQVTGPTSKVSITEACGRLYHAAAVIMDKKDSAWLRNLDLARFAEGRG